MDLCRAKGVISYEGPIRIDSDGLQPFMSGKLLFGPPVPSAKDMKKAEVDPLAEKRAHYCLLLGRDKISDAELDNLPDGI